MERTQKSKFYFIRNFRWKLLILSIAVSGVGFYLWRDSFLPYKLEIKEKNPDALNYQVVYHDFDHDGISEKLEIKNRGPNEYYIHIKNWNGGIIDQTNYGEKLNWTNLMFADITGDGYDEIFAFTTSRDSLYLYVHDIIKKKVIIKRLFLTTIEESKIPNEKEHTADFMPVCLADSSVYKDKVIIFAARSFTSLKPRSVFALDLDKEKIIRKFVTKSTLITAFPYDLNNDGLNEIIAAGIATGNVHYPTMYSDDRCWLFALDQKLNPVFPPLSFSEYPASFACLPVEDHSEKYLLAIPDYLGEKNVKNFMYLIDSKGKIHLRTQNPFRKSLEFSPMVSSQNPSEIYGWEGEKQIIKLNSRLEIVRRISTSFDKPRTIAIKDINSDGIEEVFYLSEKYLLILDQDLNLMTKFPVIHRNLALKFIQTGPNKPLDLYLRLASNTYRMKLIKNPLYTFFPFFFIGLSGIIFLALYVSDKTVYIVFYRLKLIKYFRYDSSDGIMIINHQDKVIYSNESIVQLLHLHHQRIKKNEYVSVLHHQPRIVKIIKKCKEEGESIDEKVLFTDEESKFESDVSVFPFKYFFRRGFNYLLIIKFTNIQSNSNKIHTWSRAVQKIAHDIKTPLSTVSLNLKALQIQLEKIDLSETEHQELSDDIMMMRIELDNIQSMTKNFLKFSNLDKPHSQAFNISKIIEEAKNKLYTYINSEMGIQVSIDDDVKPAWADPQQIEMVFNILLENSLAAMQGKGSISINVSSVQYLEDIKSEYLEIEVADTGPGIKEVDIKRIFEPYFSTKPEGTGMGLAIAKKIIEDNGGVIDVHSKPNLGAVFRFSLPVIKD